MTAGRVVLAAGLGNSRLAPMVGLNVPLVPNRGQIIVTEKVMPFLHHPVATIRQTDEGGVIIGESKEVTMDHLRPRAEVTTVLADRATRMFPILGELNVVRIWAAFRVITPDGFPIYEQSRLCPGAFAVSCHSGVTLAVSRTLHRRRSYCTWRLAIRPLPLFLGALRCFGDCLITTLKLSPSPSMASLSLRCAAIVLPQPFSPCGFTYLRTTPVSGAERGPYCMMGVCFECLVTVNGRSNRQACLVAVEEDMRVETQRGKASYPERTGR